jgi:hypothetical protein
MIACDLLASGTFELYFYGELLPGERDEFEQHLAVCRDCRGALEELGVIRKALAGRPVVSAPPAGDWSGFMARLDRAVDRDAEGFGGIPPATPAKLGRTSGVGYVAMAAVLALATIGVVIAMQARPAPVSAVAASGTQPSPSAPVDEAAFEAITEEHFERSKLVVLGLATKDPARARSADWTYERELASSLLTDTRMYRMAAEERGLRTLAGVMGDLETVLLQASFTDARDPASLAQIQRLIRKRDLVGKMDVVTTARGL